MIWPRGFGDQPARFEQSMCARVAASGQRLIIDDIRRYTHARNSGRPAQGNTMDAQITAWAPWAAAALIATVMPRSLAAKSAALARNTLRAAARRVTRPARILADLNQALLDWPTDDPRFLTAIYASARLISGGALVRINSAGHPLALVRSAHGDVHEFGRPGTLLGVLPDPELHDSQRVLRTGDSLILFSDGVTEARRGTDRELYGDERLRELVTGLGDLPAMATAETIRLAILASAATA
jgi:serine phosphatase RsbU (regulator of sigma subunit)